jgi:superfamily I DNA/RNA helicase
MKIFELPRVSQQIDITVCPQAAVSFEDRLPIGKEVKIQRIHSTGEILLVLEDKNWPIEGSNTQNRRLLSALLFENRPRLCWIDASLPPDQVTAELILNGRSFVGQHGINDLVVGVSDGIFDELRRLVLRQESLPQQQILDWLRDEFIVETQAGACFLISMGVATEFGNNITSFRLFGRRTSLVIDRVGDHWKVGHVIRSVRSNLDQAVLLIHGQLVFQDLSVASRMESAWRTEYDAVFKQSAGSYLGLWKEYNQIERSILQEKARGIGWLKYKSCSLLPGGNGWRLEIYRHSGNDRLIETIGQMEDVVFEIAAELPGEFDNAEELEIEPDEDDHTLSLKLAVPDASGLAVQCVSYDVEKMTIDVRPNNVDELKQPPKKDGFLFLSVSGDRYRLRRREFAWQRVRHMQTPIPGLGFLLERSDSFLAREYQPRKIANRALREAFESDPTERQKMAIHMAMNTPDIAMIQGPPGTGKTKVITALNQILMSDKSAIRKSFGDTLLTSYQHDAVENVADRSDVLGLPAIKIGTKRSRDKTYDPGGKWRRKLIEELLNDPLRKLTTPVQEIHKQVKLLLLGYRKSPTEDKVTAQLLGEVFGMACQYISPGLQEILRDLRFQLERGIAYRDLEADAGQQKIIKAARGLRTDFVSFLDDGARNASVLLQRLDKADWLAADDREVLEQAANWTDDANTPAFLSHLEDLQSRIIDRFLSGENLDRAGLINADVERVLTLVIDELYQYSLAHPDDAAEVITQRFIFDLENDPREAYRTLQSYSFVLAATCQQAVSQHMQRIKDPETKGPTISFESIIVDEASRSNPLDLLIPLSLARRRIILVGDHRQLPHMLEPDVERRLDQSTQEIQDNLRLSLFERLFRYLQERQEKDGIQRTVTLDRQYRMHPVLGEFVSDCFYKPYGEAFRSDHLDANDFAHDMKDYAKKVAVWVDIPVAQGPERGGQSKYRTPEARWIANEARKLLDDHPDCSVGVITFYSAQVRQILQEMAKPKIGLMEQRDGEIEIKEAFLQTKDGRERLRVGTVDAFQGKEFDIVLLSLVRSNEQTAKIGDETSWRRKYGFLTLENRLCVAMSRQKKLLIVVGDRTMLSDPTAEKAIPGLLAFYRLCGESHGLRISA